MKYENLKDLCRHSSSSRQYFLSLPVELQMQLSEHGDGIRTAAELHETALRLEKHNHAVMISESRDPFWGTRG